MADRVSQLPDTSGRSTPSPAGQNANDDSGNRPSSFASVDDRGGEGLLTPPGGSSLRSQESRLSLHEQFATSRREFEFEEDEQSLEPAPVVAASEDGAYDEIEHSEEDAMSDISDGTVRRLLHANENSSDYYTLLGLEREPPPTVAQIRAAYYRLSLAFHPDKHPQFLKAAAQSYFTRLQKAYETLIEPRKRVIYDLEGEEGVQNEYQTGGAMGQSGEAERQIGVKTMGAEEFKKWFMSVLLERERRSIGELIGSSGTCKLILKAHNPFNGSPKALKFTHRKNDFDILLLPEPLITAQVLQLRQSYSVPLPGLGRLLQSQLPSWKAILRGDILIKTEEGGEPIRSNWEDTMGPLIPKLTFTGTVTGTLQESLAVKVPDDDHPDELMPPPAHWYTLLSDNFHLSTRLDHIFPEVKDHDESKSIASILQGTDLEVSAGIFPKRSLDIGLGRSFALVEDTRPFHFHFRAFLNHSLKLKPPVLSFRVSRPLGKGQTAYWQFSSGDFEWPAFLQKRGLMPVTSAPLWLPRGQLLPTMRIGYLWAETGATMIQTDEEDDIYILDPDDGRDEKLINSKNPTTNDSWNFAVDAWPDNAIIFMTWGRDLFIRASEPPIRSRIRRSGEAVAKSSHFGLPTSRGVRVEIEGNLDLKLSLGLVVRGVRRIGNFSKIGVGVGLNPKRGLFISFSWSRLGQNIIIPVIIIPAEEGLDIKSIFWALAIPWAAYVAVEFAILRPSLQRTRQKLVEKKQKELRENVMKRRLEAEQAVLLMLPLVEHRQAIEREQNGLVILKAEYGIGIVGLGSKMSWRSGEVADVTVALAMLVDGGQLSLPRGLRKSQIIGFWDPAPLKRKWLSVDYLFGGKQHHVDVVGNDALSIPMRGHEI